jgi:hypothetical protein
MTYNESESFCFGVNEEKPEEEWGKVKDTPRRFGREYPSYLLKRNGGP